MNSGLRSVAGSLAGFRRDRCYFRVHNTVPHLVHQCKLLKTAQPPPSNSPLYSLYRPHNYCDKSRKGKTILCRCSFSDHLWTLQAKRTEFCSFALPETSIFAFPRFSSLLLLAFLLCYNRINYLNKSWYQNDHCNWRRWHDWQQHC